MISAAGPIGNRQFSIGQAYTRCRPDSERIHDFRSSTTGCYLRCNAHWSWILSSRWRPRCTCS